MRRRSGLVNASDPVNRDAGFTAVLTGKNFKAEECGLAFVFGTGFAMYLGGPIFYGQQHGWDGGA